MANPLIAHAIVGSSTGNNATTSAIDTTGATLLVALIVTDTGGGTMSDSKGNTWTALTAHSGGTTVTGQLFYVSNPTVGSGHTFTPTISSATNSQDTTLTGWTTSISAGDTLRFNINSASTVTRLNLVLTVTVS